MQKKSWDDVLTAIDAVLTGTFETPEAMAAEVAKVREQIAAMIAEAATAGATAEEISAAAEGAAKAMAKLTQAENLISAKRQVADMQTKNRAALEGYKGAFNVPSGNTVSGSSIVVKSTPYRGKAFKSYGADAGKAAHRAGASIAALLGSESAAQYCKDNGIEFRRKDMNTGDDALGGFIVTGEVETAILYYREERGVARNIMEVKTGSAPSVTRSKNIGGTNVKALGEGQQYTASDVKFDQIGVTAKKFGALTVGSYELNDDSFANLAEEVAKDHGYAHATNEDRIAFLGSGASTDNGLLGITETFKKIVTDAGGTFTTDAHKLYAAGIAVATGATVASVTLADLFKMQAKVATFPGMNNAFILPSQIWYGQIVPSIMDKGGLTTTEIVNGVPRTFLNGFPVIFADELYTPILTAENNAFVAFFGDAAQAGLWYDRQGLTVTPSTEAGFLTDELYWKSTTRYGLNWWNVGNGSSTAALRKRGALAALVTKN